MELRKIDYFAGHAMAILLARFNLNESVNSDDLRVLTARAFRIAEAMVRASHDYDPSPHAAHYPGQVVKE